MSAVPYQIKTEGELVFSFVSEGRKGRIVKIVRYKKMREGIYNLAFGDQIQGSSEVDFYADSGNDDILRVLATIAKTMNFFFKKHPGALLFFEGTTARHNKLYHRAIKNNQSLFEGELYFYGGNEEIEIELFSKEREYSFFWVSKFPLI